LTSLKILLTSLKIKEINECYQHDSIYRKGHKLDPINQLQEKTYGQQGEYKRADEAYDKKRNVIGTEILKVFHKGQETRSSHDRHCHDERKIRSCAMAHPKHDPSGDRSTGTGKARPQGKHLDETNSERFCVCHLINRFDRWLLWSKQIGSDHKYRSRH